MYFFYIFNHHSADTQVWTKIDPTLNQHPDVESTSSQHRLNVVRLVSFYSR